MKKSVYSIVLMDDVIRAVDAQAYRLGTSRSNLINQILAEQLSCVTPEMRMRDIFHTLADSITSDFQIQQQRSESFITLKTALAYKYRPTINYKVELARSPDDYLGTLKVQIRTQSNSLISLFDCFFEYWTTLEIAALKELGFNGIYSFSLNPGRFQRRLLNTTVSSDEQKGQTLCSYITLLDKAVKSFFDAPQSFSAFLPPLEQEYKTLIQHTII